MKQKRVKFHLPIIPQLSWANNKKSSYFLVVSPAMTSLCPAQGFAEWM